MSHNRKLIVYIATSLDGYIAKPGDDLSFLSIVQKEGEDYGYSEFTASVDTVIMGRKTYEWVTGNIHQLPHPDKETFIITKTYKEPIGKTSFFTGNLNELITHLKSKSGKNIYCDGGSVLVNELLKLKLVDEIILSVIPVLLGNGLPLFQEHRPEHRLILIQTKTYESGLVQLHYKVIKEE